MKIEDIDRLLEMGFSQRDHDPDRLYWAYFWRGGEFELEISWSLIERSMQTILYVNGVEVNRTSSEGLEESTVSNGKVESKFYFGDAVTTLVVHANVKPMIYWSTIHV